MADMENWMRVFAANHAAGNWDSFGSQNGQNLYGYIGALGTKYSLLMWDFNIVIGNSSSVGAGAESLDASTAPTNMANIYNNPTFLRMYWRALQELGQRPAQCRQQRPVDRCQIQRLHRQRPQRGKSQVANIEPWLSQAQTSIASQLAAVNATSFAVNSSVTVSNDIAYLTGTAPVNVATVWINGAAYPLTWTSLTSWTVAVPLATGTNRLSVTGVDRNNHLIAGDSNSVSVVYAATNASPVGQIVINEIMYQPAVANAQFVELYNNSTNTAFDLSGWQFQGLGLHLPQRLDPRADQLSGSGGKQRGLRRGLRRDQSGV